MNTFLPSDYREATLIGRVWQGRGPSPVLVHRGSIYDLSHVAPTVSQVLNSWCGDVDRYARSVARIADIEDVRFVPAWEEDSSNRPMKLLSPVDLQVVKASGVTFAVSAIERVIEERAMGNSDAAADIRAALAEKVGSDIRSVEPGSEKSRALKSALIDSGMWSQYLEVAIGPDAEVFTKAPVLSSVGWGDYIGVRADSDWNNPEPEIVVVCDNIGRPLGACLGNDVNLRDFEGRSALLLGKAKDNTASASLGPFIRVFDDSYSMDDVRAAEVRLDIEGEDGFQLAGSSAMSEISRDPDQLIQQTIGANHQYPDGFALYLGTMFAPTEDRDAPGRGFTHKLGDRVRISSEKLGILENRVTTCDQAPRWSFGVGALIKNLSERGLLNA